MSSGAHSHDPLARNDVDSPEIESRIGVRICDLDHLSPRAGRGRREAPGEGASPRVRERRKSPTPTLPRESGRGSMPRNRGAVSTNTNAQHFHSSCPGLTRASIRFARIVSKKMDCGVKAMTISCCLEGGQGRSAATGNCSRSNSPMMRVTNCAGWCWWRWLRRRCGSRPRAWRRSAPDACPRSAG